MSDINYYASPKPTENEVQFGFDFDTFFKELKEADQENRFRENFIVKMKWNVRPAES